MSLINSEDLEYYNTISLIQKRILVYQICINISFHKTKSVLQCRSMNVCCERFFGNNVKWDKRGLINYILNSFWGNRMYSYSLLALHLCDCHSVKVTILGFFLESAFDLVNDFAQFRKMEAFQFLA